MTETSTTKIEQEVKFRLNNKEEIIVKLKKLGAEDLGQQKESDTYLKLDGKEIRIRKLNKEGIITFKQFIESESKAKVRQETEIKVNDPETLIAMLKALGLKESKRKEKIRHSFRLDKTIICLDKLPFIGEFIELEAETEEALKETCQKLGLDYSKASNTNYMSIFFNWYMKNIRRFKDSKIKIIPVFENEEKFLAEEKD